MVKKPAAPAKTTGRKRWWIWAGLAAVLVLGGIWTKGYWWPSEAIAQAPQPTQAPDPNAAKPAAPRIAHVARVNTERISREELAKECLVRHGTEVLTSLTNRYLIETECKRLQVVVSEKEIQEEVDRVARRFGLTTDQYLSMLRQERDISPREYAQEIIWPTIAVKKLAASQLTVTPEELQKAYESHYGPAVQVRMIVLDKHEAAVQVRQAALANPQEFKRLAMQHSMDKNTASTGGLIQPIHMHVGDPRIEKTAFALKPGQVSEVLPVGNRFVVLRCEQHYPPSPPQGVAPETVQQHLSEMIREQKLRTAGQNVFQQLQHNAKILNVINTPEIQHQHPGVAAMVNNHPVLLAELEDAAIIRFGREVLEDLISRRLLEQECKKRQIEITAADIENEIVTTAKDLGYATPADWLKKVQEEQGITLEFYRSEVVWPAVVLKKLAAPRVQVTEEDLTRGFEANYGPRVRLRAIFFQNQRRAQEIWEEIARTPNLETVERLARQHSVDPSTRELGGLVPPLHKHCGNPLLEKEAFQLKPGELSPVIQLGDKHVVLFCEGLTEPVNVDFAAVREDIYKHVYDRKLQSAMGATFDEIQSAATIDNILAGTSQTPEVSAGPAAATGPQPQGPRPPSTAAGGGLTPVSGPLRK